jgi:hypothetical protein
MLLLDTALSILARIAEVLAIRPASDTMVLRTRPADHRYDEVPRLYPTHPRADLNYLTNRLMADD